MIDITVHRYPVDSATRTQLIDLLQQVFPRTDVDWLQSMRGMYADVLTTCNVVGSLDGKPVGCASVAFAARDPEVCVIEDVITLPHARGKGVARTLTEHAVQIGFDAGCRVAYLGNTPTESCVYDRVGFTRLSGVFMRRAAPGSDNYEAEAFAPGQSTTARETHWGDLPGVVCLMAQPTGAMLGHYDLGLVNAHAVEPRRAVSNFTSVKYAAENSGGCMWSLASSRVLGFASLIVGPGTLRDRTARCDFVCHEHYTNCAGDLIEAMIEDAKQRGIALLEAFVAEVDADKRQSFEAAGFHAMATLPGLFHNQKWMNIQVLHKHV